MQSQATSVFPLIRTNRRINLASLRLAFFLYLKQRLLLFSSAFLIYYQCCNYNNVCNCLSGCSSKCQGCVFPATWNSFLLLLIRACSLFPWFENISTFTYLFQPSLKQRNTCKCEFSRSPFSSRDGLPLKGRIWINDSSKSPPRSQLFIIVKWKTIKAAHEHNRLRHSVGKCIKRVTACHIVHDVLILLMSQVPVLITDHHMCTPGQPFLFFFQFRSSTMYAEWNTRETPTPAWLERGTRPDTWEGARVHRCTHYLHLSRSNEGTQHLVSKTACQSNTVEAPETEMV